MGHLFIYLESTLDSVRRSLAGLFQCEFCRKDGFFCVPSLPILQDRDSEVQPMLHIFHGPGAWMLPTYLQAVMGRGSRILAPSRDFPGFFHRIVPMLPSCRLRGGGWVKLLLHAFNARSSRSSKVLKGRRRTTTFVQNQPMRVP